MNCNKNPFGFLKFIYSEKATKFCKIFPLLLTVCTAVKSKGKISQNFAAFSEYMNFKEKRMKTWHFLHIQLEFLSGIHKILITYIRKLLLMCIIFLLSGKKIYRNQKL